LSGQSAKHVQLWCLSSYIHSFQEDCWSLRFPGWLTFPDAENVMSLLKTILSEKFLIIL
jgi:hypothetical protein